MKKEEQIVCVNCGHELDGKCDCPSAKYYKEKPYFCGNCGERGMHVAGVEVSKWIKARKLLGLSFKINDYNLP